MPLLLFFLEIVLPNYFIVELLHTPEIQTQLILSCFLNLWTWTLSVTSLAEPVLLAHYLVFVKQLIELYSVYLSKIPDLKCHQEILFLKCLGGAQRFLWSHGEQSSKENGAQGLLLTWYLETTFGSDQAAKMEFSAYIPTASSACPRTSGASFAFLTFFTALFFYSF